jgi:hypothetical protein
MKKSGLARHYDVLTAEERFRLVLQAFARDDRAEVDRLDRSCPRKTYTMSDAAYQERRDLIAPVVMAVCADLTHYVAKLEVAAALAWFARELRDRTNDKADSVADQLRRRATRAARRGHEPADGLSVEHADDWLESVSLLLGYAIDPLERLTSELSDEMARKAREVWDGFGRFCHDEVGLPPETVMGALLPPMVERLEAQREALDAAEPDPAAVTEGSRTLARGWRRRLGL